MATAKSNKRVEAFTHEDSRVNIPTEELSAFVQNDEEAPGTMLYPRDPSLDPQLVWKGKDEQDREDLAVPVVPIYIQEKIHPQALMRISGRGRRRVGSAKRRSRTTRRISSMISMGSAISKIGSISIGMSSIGQTG